MSFNLEEILSLLDPPKKFEYRVYYNESLICTRKSTALVGQLDDDPYIVVDQTTYNKIEFCPNYQICDGEIKLIPKPTMPSVLMKKRPNGKFKTLKNNMMIAVDDNYTKEVDCWVIRDDL